MQAKATQNDGTASEGDPSRRAHLASESTSGRRPSSRHCRSVAPPNLLAFSDKRAAAQLLKKVLLSAVANAENNLGADVDELKIATIMVDEGPRLKRMHARAKGRGSQIIKRTSHITVVVGS